MKKPRRGPSATRDHWLRVLDIILEDDFLRRCSKIATRDPEMRLLLDKYLSALLAAEDLANTPAPLVKTR
jgi:hypothetical protein